MVSCTFQVPGHPVQCGPRCWGWSLREWCEGDCCLEDVGSRRVGGIQKFAHADFRYCLIDIHVPNVSGLFPVMTRS
jgi:hypothetical protein